MLKCSTSCQTDGCTKTERFFVGRSFIYHHQMVGNHCQSHSFFNITYKLLSIKIYPGCKFFTSVSEPWSLSQKSVGALERSKRTTVNATGSMIQQSSYVGCSSIALVSLESIHWPPPVTTTQLNQPSLRSVDIVCT